MRIRVVLQATDFGGIDVVGGTMNKDKVTLYLDMDDINELNRIAEAQDTSASRLIRLMIRDFIAQHKDNSKAKK